MRDPSYDYADLERKINSSLKTQREEMARLTETLNSLTRTVNTVAAPQSYTEIVNLIDNSHPEWSHAAYTSVGIAPATVTDDNRRAYNWFTQLASAIELLSTAAEALKANGHTAFPGAASDQPIWDMPNGEVQLGGTTNNWDLAMPLPNNLIFPGLTFRFQFEAKLKAGETIPADVQFFVAMYDNTAGQRKVIEGGNFTITGEIYGTPGASTVKYQVVARTDSGEEAISNILEFTTAPSSFNQNNHPRINVRGAPGFVAFDIYRLKDGVYTLQYTIQNAIEATYFDVGNAPLRVVSGFPSLTATPPKAYAKTRTFSPGSLSSNNFVRHSLTVQVPTTYNTTLTSPGMQWLRFGLTGLADSQHQVVIRRIGLSFAEGTWSRSANDTRTGVRSTVSTTATSSSAGSSGAGVGQPPPPGSGAPDCVLLSTKIAVRDADTAEPKEMTLHDIMWRCRSEKIYCDSLSMTCGRVVSVRIGYASRVFRIKIDGAELVCTYDHPLITSRFDIFGTPASKLKQGMNLIHRGRLHQILEIKQEFGDFEVGIPVLEGSHLFMANGFLSHNVKPAYAQYQS